MGGGLATVGLLTVADLGEWFSLIERIQKSPAAPIAVVALVIAAMVWLGVLQLRGRDACEHDLKVLKAEFASMREAMATLYGLLANDDRYPELPPFDEFVKRPIEILGPNKSRPAYSRPPEGESR